MRVRRVLMLSVLLVSFVAFSGAQETAATGISEQCKTDIIAVARRCAEQCQRDLRCFIRCAIANFPASCR